MFSLLHSYSMKLLIY